MKKGKTIEEKFRDTKQLSILYLVFLIIILIINFFYNSYSMLVFLIICGFLSNFYITILVGFYVLKKLKVKK